VALREAHERYARERDAAVAPDHEGPVPTGGVGGARAGVKCLHAHLAWYLAGGDDPVGRWTAERLELDPSSYSVVGTSWGHRVVEKAVAVVDCGSNSTRLIVIDQAGRVLKRLMRITRLGEGMSITGALSSDAISRTVGVLKEYTDVIATYGASRVRVIATSAARDATNCDELFEAISRVTGQMPELLSGTSEGRYAFAGATAELDPLLGPYIVADIGGGSTELVTGSVGSRPAVVSLNIGCVRITEQLLLHDPPLPAELLRASHHIRRELKAARTRLSGEGPASRLVAVAGTATALAAMDGNVAASDRAKIHHRKLSKSSVDSLLRGMIRENVESRSMRPGLEPERAPVIIGGTLILSAVMACFSFDTCVVSEADILDGLARALIV
jgi:exopolyphosphatase/guanosine-5'-triphosphate,3'-diphosphate pyrophosphatase